MTYPPSKHFQYHHNFSQFLGFYTEGILSMGKWDWLLAAGDAEGVVKWINKLKDSTLTKCGTQRFLFHQQINFPKAIIPCSTEEYESLIYQCFMGQQLRSGFSLQTFNASHNQISQLSPLLYTQMSSRFCNDKPQSSSVDLKLVK